jgi:hypothetical protein
MTVVIIIIVVLALLVLGLVLSPAGAAIRTSPRRIRPSRRYKRPPTPPA